MAVRFLADLDVLVADIVAGGFGVQSIRSVQDARGRTIDVFLNNYVVVCWDSFSCVVWAEGPRSQMNDVETYLKKLYEGPTFLRFFVTWRTRWGLSLNSANRRFALWLLRSETFPARGLRSLIKGVPRISILQHRRGSGS